MNALERLRSAQKPLTYGETLGPAMEIRDQAEADEYKEALIAYQMRVGCVDQATAAKTANANLGYYAGYYGEETRARVERLFRCSHPIFGAIAEKGSPTPEEALAAGKAIGKRLR